MKAFVRISGSLLGRIIGGTKGGATGLLPRVPSAAGVPGIGAAKGERMFRVAILEDDRQQAELLAHMVMASPFADRIKIVGSEGSADSFAEAFSQGVDILFMDIRLGSNVATGIDLVEALLSPTSTTQVIYVSGYLEYASDVYRTKHTWFLSKPVEQLALDTALARAIENLEQIARQPLLVRSNGALLQIMPDGIMYIESERRKVRIHERSRTIETYAKMADVEQGMPAQFVRCHKSFLVNMDYIAELRARDVVLIDGTVLPVSQRCRKKLHDRFVDHVGRAL